LGLPTWLVAIEREGLSAAALEERLRSLTPPVVARIEHDRVVLDLRTVFPDHDRPLAVSIGSRSEEHTSELQSPYDLVCRLLLEIPLPPRALHSFPTRRSSDLLGLPTWLVAIEREGLSAAALEERLRSLTPPVVARIEHDRVVLDLRTVFPDHDRPLAVSIGS